VSESREEQYRQLGKAVWDYYRHRCTVQVRHAIERKSLPPLRKRRCVDCGKRAQAYDHRNYARPLDVAPVCDKCNQRRGPAELSVEVVISHLLESPEMPYENKRLRVNEMVVLRTKCACCEPVTHFVRRYSDEDLDYLLTTV
jgi:hypothetical protein